MITPLPTSVSTGGLRTLPSRLAEIRQVLRKEYCKTHTFPWIIAYSGGKDSTLLLQMVWEAVVDTHEARRRRKIIVLGNDTLVESPLVIRHLRDSMASIEAAASAHRMPIEIRITMPAIDQTFWVNVIGRGYIPPTRNFRWCTDRMKILPTSRLLKDVVRESAGAVLLVGTRRQESHNRKRSMDRRNVSAKGNSITITLSQGVSCWLH